MLQPRIRSLTRALALSLLLPLAHAFAKDAPPAALLISTVYVETYSETNYPKIVTEFEPQDRIGIAAFGTALKGKSLRVELTRDGRPVTRSALMVGLAYPALVMVGFRALEAGRYGAVLLDGDQQLATTSFVIADPFRPKPDRPLVVPKQPAKKAHLYTTSVARMKINGPPQMTFRQKEIPVLAVRELGAEYAISVTDHRGAPLEEFSGGAVSGVRYHAMQNVTVPGEYTATLRAGELTETVSFTVL